MNKLIKGKANSDTFVKKTKPDKYNKDSQHDILQTPELSLREMEVTFSQKQLIQEVIQRITKIMNHEAIGIGEMFGFTQTQKDISVEHFWK